MAIELFNKSLENEIEKMNKELLNNLKINENNEAKPEIKKVKKQETEKREYI